jgi:cytoskeletal protein RodZ
MDVGATLRHARTRKGLTLEQLARATKISISQLEALEVNDFDRLPASIYTRGFLRAYAREVDLDPEEIVDEYLEQVAEAPSMQLADSNEADRSPGRMVMVGSETLGEYRAALFADRRVALPALAAVAVIIVLGAYSIVASRRGGDEVVANAQTQPPPPAQPAPPAVTDATHAASVTPDSLRIDMKLTGLCWVAATADRTPVIARLLQAGENQSFDAKEEFVLRVGDPSTIAIAINGVSARSLGAPGQPVTVQINKQNYREFLVP